MIDCPLEKFQIFQRTVAVSPSVNIDNAGQRVTSGYYFVVLRGTAWTDRGRIVLLK